MYIELFSTYITLKILHSWNLRLFDSIRYSLFCFYVSFFTSIFKLQINKWRCKWSSQLPWFSTESRETKPKAITLTNQKRRGQFSEPISIWSNYMQPAPSAGKCARANRDCFGSASHWLRKLHELCQPITERSKAKPKKTWITGFQGV